MWLYTPGVPGRASSASIGTALNGASVIAPTSQGAGLVRVNVMVLPEVVMPDTLWPSMYFFITAALVAAASG
jgi:hypothetical protein